MAKETKDIEESKESKEHEQEELLETIRKRFKLAEDAEAVQREMMLADMKFENGEQWDEDARRERESDGRPSLVINKIAPMLKKVISDMRRNRSGIKVRPVDSQSDVKTAEIFTGYIRNIENVSNADAAYDMGGECAVRCGLGYFRIVTEYVDDSVFEQDIQFNRIENPFTVYRDPYSRKPVGQDSKFYFVTEKINKDEFKERYPDTDVKDFEGGQYDSSWVDESEVRIAEYWWIEEEATEFALLNNGMTVNLADIEITPEFEAMVVKKKKGKTNKVKWCLTNGYEIIDNEVNDWAGKYIPIFPVIGEEVWIEGKRYLRSALYHAKDPQRLYNWARSTACETLAMAPRQPYVTTKESIEGFEPEWALANRKPLPYLLYNEGHEPPQRNMNPLPDNGSMAEAMTSSDEIKATMGIYDASLGAQGNETSGVAIRARQMEGDSSTFVFQDNLNNAIKYAAVVLVDLVPRIVDTQRILRLLNIDGTEGWETVNIELPDGQKLNDLSVGKYDVVYDASGNYLNARIEAAEGMLTFMQAFPPSAPIIGPRLAKNSDWPESQEIAEELKALTQGGQQQDPQAQQQQQQQMQMQQQHMQMEMASKQMDLQMKKMTLQMKQVEMQEKVASGQIKQEDARQAITEGQMDIQKLALELENQHLQNMKLQQEMATGGMPQTMRRT